MLLSCEVLYFYITNHTIVATNYQRESNGILYLELDSLFAYNEFSGSFFVRINGEKAEILEKGSRTVTVTRTFSSCPVSGKTGDCTWQYDQQTRKLTISGSGKMSDYDENEEAPWYPYRDRIRDVVIESGVTHIGAWSFYNTGAPIFRVNIPDSVKTIGSYAFAGAKLSSVEIPDSVVTIGDYAFTSCVSLEKVTIGNHVKTIGNGAFQRNTALKSVIIPDSVESIEEYAFKDCINLQFVYLKENLKSIGSGAFYNTGIISITIPDSVEEIGSVALKYCSCFKVPSFSKAVRIAVCTASSQSFSFLSMDIATRYSVGSLSRIRSVKASLVIPCLTPLF